MTYEEDYAKLAEFLPFAGSKYELYAIEVFEHGMTAPGSPVYASCDEAIADWRVDYEFAVSEEARAVADGAVPFAEAIACLSWAKVRPPCEPTANDLYWFKRVDELIAEYRAGTRTTLDGADERKQT